MPGLDFSDKRILITGASRGIGAQIAMQLAEQGAHPFLLARNKQDLASLAATIKEKSGKAVSFAAADVTNESQIKKAVNSMLREYGAIDGIIHNAGFAKPDYFMNLDIDIFRKHVEVDYLGAVIVLKEALPHLPEGGFISLTSSVVGYLGVFGYTAYAGPKFALFGFGESLRQELLSRSVSVSVLCPPDTDTPGYENENLTKPPETVALSEGAKLMTPEKVASVFLKKLKKRKFVIMVNFESALFYRLNGWFPGLVRTVMSSMVQKAQKKLKKS